MSLKVVAREADKIDNLLFISIVVFLILFLFLLSGQLIGLAMAMAGIIILLFLVGKGQLAMVGRLQFNMANSFILGCIPLFILMGFILIHSRLSDMVYRAVSPLVSLIPGGLLHTNVVAGSVFGATCGSSIAGTAAVATVALPQLKMRGYDKKLTYGSVAAGGTMSALIPPSLAFIIYGSIVGESIGALFIAGVVPGVIMTLSFMIYIAIRAVSNPVVAPKETVARQQLLRSLINILPIVVLAALVLGSIYLGIATPTEASAVGAVASMAISAAYRRLNWGVIRKALEDTVRITCMVMILIVGAQFFAMSISMLRIPSRLTEWFISLTVHRLVIFSFIVILYIVLGMFMEATPIQLMTLPLTYPVAMALGFGSVWFGVMVTILVQIGLLTPPVGMDVFITHKLSGERDMTHAIKGAIPFALIMLAVAVLITAFPDLATWLPSRMLKRRY